MSSERLKLVFVRDVEREREREHRVPPSSFGPSWVDKVVVVVSLLPLLRSFFVFVFVLITPFFVVVLSRVFSFLALGEKEEASSLFYLYYCDHLSNVTWTVVDSF